MVHNQIKFGIEWTVRGGQSTTVWFTSKKDRTDMQKNLRKNARVDPRSIVLYTQYNKDDVRNE